MICWRKFLPNPYNLFYLKMSRGEFVYNFMFNFARLLIKFRQSFDEEVGQGVGEVH